MQYCNMHILQYAIFNLSEQNVKHSIGRDDYATISNNIKESQYWFYVGPPFIDLNLYLIRQWQVSNEKKL